MILGGPAGLLADRVESRRLLRDVSLAQAAIAAVLAFTFDGLAATLGLTALLGVGVALAQPAEFALAPAVAGSGGVAGRQRTHRGGPLPRLHPRPRPRRPACRRAAARTHRACSSTPARLLAVALAAQAAAGAAPRPSPRGDRSGGSVPATA